MKTISVSASGQYDILVGRDILDHIGTFLGKNYPNCKVAIVSDSNVWPIYGSSVEASLIRVGITSESYIFSAGEQSKTTSTYFDIIEFLARKNFCRTDVIVALGGGVVGDIAGFAAATYLRGIAYVQVPTSLLSMVDSSVGGKTGIDLPAGKNLLGAFKQPCLVVCDVNTLNTLPRQHYFEGCAEVVKYGMLYDSALIDYLIDCAPVFDAEDIIEKCITFKRNVVQEDEFDNGCRQMLNFGHTFGHGIEAASDYSLSHGCCVALGMVIVTKAAENKGMCTQGTTKTLISLLDRFALPVDTEIAASDMLSWILHDKKRHGSKINLIIPRCIGKCEIIAMEIDEMESFIKAGL